MILGRGVEYNVSPLLRKAKLIFSLPKPLGIEFHNNRVLIHPNQTIPLSFFMKLSSILNF